MNIMAWLMLVLVAGGISGGIALSLKARMKAGKKGRVPAHPVWQVLLEGGVNGRSDDGPDEPGDDGPGEPEKRDQRGPEKGGRVASSNRSKEHHGT